jgi:hypothetical protein
MRRTSFQDPTSIARPADFTRSDEGYSEAAESAANWDKSFE